MKLSFPHKIQVWKQIFTPARVLVLGFLSFILGGALLLWLPLCAQLGKSISFIDALFTSASAICVTGLVVVDVGSVYNTLGQTIVMLLIELGGLGYMVVTTILGIIIGRKINLQDKIVIQESLQWHTFEGILPFVRYIFFVTLGIQVIGTVILSFRFIPQFGLWQGMYVSLFHSVSAFCNAGFSLFTNNLINYKDDMLVVFTICGLIIIGGIGYSVINDLYKNRTWKKFSLHTKIVVSVTIVLILLGMFLILAFETNNKDTLANFSIRDKLLTAFFQSVTPRTAGFNTINIGTLSEITLFVIIMLMFIGASPGGTGGGIKTTTFTTVIQSVWATLLRRKEADIFHRRIPADIAQNSFVLFIMSLFWVFGITFLLMFIEKNVTFLKTLFEVTSAFGTVGLSTGNPLNSLSLCYLFTPWGKLLLILTMFIGRVGLLTVGVALLQENVVKYRYAEERIMIG